MAYGWKHGVHLMYTYMLTLYRYSVYWLQFSWQLGGEEGAIRAIIVIDKRRVGI